MIRNTASVVAALAAFFCSMAGAQTMEKKWDQKCLDASNKTFISCVANSGGREPARSKCDADKVNAQKLCKRK